MAVKLQYAMDTNGKSISIDDSEVKSGQGQEFTCPDPYCDIKVNPKKGEDRQHHFAHKSGSNCYGLETSLHLMAKEAFLFMKTFRLPIYFFSPREYYTYYSEEIREIEKTIGFPLPKEVYEGWNFDSLFRPVYSTPPLFTSKDIELSDYTILIENHQGKIKPDLKLVSKRNPEKQLLIEVAVTHKIDKNKEDYIKNNNLALLEIDLSSFHTKGTIFSKAEVINILKENHHQARWRNISRKTELVQLKKKEILQIIEEKLILIKKVYETIVEDYFKPNVKYLGNEPLGDIEKEMNIYPGDPEYPIIKSHMLLRLFLSKFKEGNIYKSEELKRLEKEKERQDWRKEFYKDYPYKKL